MRKEDELITAFNRQGYLFFLVCMCSFFFSFSRNAAVNAMIGAAFGAAGQRCMALSVAVLVGEAREWANDIAEGAAKLKVLQVPSRRIHPFIRTRLFVKELGVEY